MSAIAATKLLRSPLYSFEPRPDIPAEYDQQTSWMNSKAKVAVCVAGNRCLAPEQEIYDPATKISRPICEIDSDFHVWAWDGQKPVIARAKRPFIKGRSDLYEIRLSNGESFTATLAHRILTFDGWQPLYSVHAPIAYVPHPASFECRQEYAQVSCPSEFLQDASRLFHREQGYQEHCWQDHRQYDELLQCQLRTDRETPQLQDGVPEHIQQHCNGDAAVDGQGCTRTYQQFFPLSNLDASRLQAAQYDVDSYGVSEHHLLLSDQAYTSRLHALSSRLPNPLNRAYQLFAEESALPDTISSSVQLANEYGAWNSPIEGIDQRQCYITSIKFVRQGIYYDLEVPDYHNYWMAGIFHHNSGKTYSAAIKCARIVTQDVEPPCKDATFMVLSDSFEQVTKICWKDKLSNMIPEHVIDWDRCIWFNRAANLPYEIVLKPWPGTDKNWVIEFRSSHQTRRKFQGRAYYGLWVSEQTDWNVIEEIRRGFIDHPIPGTCFLEFTPLDPDLTVELEEKMEASAMGELDGWEFFQLNSEKNTYIDQAELRAYLQSVSPEIRETRRIGKLASFAGAVFPGWNPAIHLLNDQQWHKITGKLPPERYLSLREFKDQTPQNVFFRRGVDWGESLEHAFACIFGWKDGAGRWFIFDEYVENKIIRYDHRIAEIKDRYPWPATDSHFGFTYADPSRPELISMFGREDMVMSRANNSVEAGFETIRSLLAVNEETQQPRLFIYRNNCPILAKQIWKLRYMRSMKPGTMVDTRVNKKKAPNQPQDWENDAIDACRYMIHSDTTLSGKGPQIFSTIPSADRYGHHLDGTFKGQR